MTQLLVGTNNPCKLQLIRQHLEGLSIQCVSPSDLGLQKVSAPENARDALGNALEKARAWHQLTQLPVLTEDSGLILLDLPLNHPDQPGVHVRRAAGYEMDDKEMLAWFSAIAHRHGGMLRAAWQDAWCLFIHEDEIATTADDLATLADCSFQLVDTPCAARHHGWPLDSLSIDQAGRYFAEASLDSTDVVAPQVVTRPRIRLWLREQVTQHLLAAQ